ncbi:MAG: hypothetical protein MJZ29_02590 [Bacteroidaceae bacterium]|nr:hypothetical protein [Bacteroidaceae bacterium]
MTFAFFSSAKLMLLPKIPKFISLKMPKIPKSYPFYGVFAENPQIYFFENAENPQISTRQSPGDVTVVAEKLGKMSQNGSFLYWKSVIKRPFWHWKSVNILMKVHWKSTNLTLANYSN